MRPLATGGGRTARTDQSDKGMCLCREAGGGGDPTDMGCTRLHPPGVGVTEPRANWSRNQQNWGWSVGMRHLPVQLCHQQHFFLCFGSRPRRFEFGGIIRGCGWSRSVTASPAPAFPQKRRFKEEKGCPSRSPRSLPGWALICWLEVSLRLCPSRLISCSESSGSSRKPRAGFL